MSINGKNLRMELHRNTYTDEVINNIATAIADASNSTVKNVDVAAKRIEIVTTNANKDKVVCAAESCILDVINNLGDTSEYSEAALMEKAAIEASKSVINMYNVLPSKVGNKTCVKIEL